MPVIHSNRRMSNLVLCTSLVLITALFAVRFTYSAVVYYTISLILFTVAWVAAWKLGLWAVIGKAGESRSLAIAGALLITPWVLFSFLVGFSAPQIATPPENQLRYIILLINTLAVAGGLVVLRQALSEAGERFYSTLGFAAIMFAFPFYAIFTSISLVEYRAIERAVSQQANYTNPMLDEISMVALFFGAALTYLATAAFAAALGKISWLGRSAGRVFVGICLFAVLCVAIKMVEVFRSPQSPMWNFSPWYAIPGNVLSIPAMPWIMLALVGVVLLKRAGEGRI